MAGMTGGVETVGARYEALFGCKALAPLLRSRAWTVSGKVDRKYAHGRPRRKTPLNLPALMRGVHFGARYADPEDMGTAEQVMGLFGGAPPPNLAVYWNVDLCHYVVLDVESHADDGLLDAAMGLPAVYAESSLSGRGRHLVMPMPDLKPAERRMLREKKNLQMEDEGWEIHLRHWVTFTGYALALREDPDGAGLWRSMFARAMERRASDGAALPGGTGDFPGVDGSGLPKGPEPSHLREILSCLGRPGNRPRHGIEHYRYRNGPPAGKGPYDMSAWEMGCLDHYAILLMRCMRDGFFIDAAHAVVHIGHEEWDDAAMAAILYRAVLAGVLPIEHRDKHDTYRNGRPYMYEEACSAVRWARSRDPGGRGGGERAGVPPAGKEKDDDDADDDGGEDPVDPWSGGL